MKMSLQNRNLLITLLLGGGAVAYVFFMFLPMQAETVQLREDLRTQREFVEQSLTLVGAMSSVEQELQAARDFAGAWRESAPRAGQLARLPLIRAPRQAPQAAERSEPLYKCRASLGLLCMTNTRRVFNCSSGARTGLC